jgi:hypothetical protein
MTNPSAPFLSLVSIVRNSTGPGDATVLWDALSFNHEQLTARGVPHEILLIELTDHSTDPSVLDWVERIVPGGRGDILTRFAIDPRYDGAIPMCATRNGGAFILNNVGIRRARGSFVLCLGAGICMGRRVLDKIGSSRIEAGVVYRAPRVDVRRDVWRDSQSCDVFEDPGRVIGHAGLADPADFILLDRASFHELRGFAELYNLNGRPMGRELVTRAAAIGRTVQNLGAPVYRSYDASASSSGWRNVERPAMERAPRNPSHVAYLNPDTWGLAAAPERRLGPHRIWLDFDWAAVARLVDFSRVSQLATI